MYYTVYRVTNIINNKFYIGVHKTLNIDDSYLGSGKIIKSAVKMYGVKNFKKDILFIFDNKEAMYNKEKEIVTPEVLMNPLCYNLLCGGRDTFKNNEYNLEKAVKARHKQKYIYINDGVNTRCILPEDELNFINAGWVRGNLTLSKNKKGSKVSTKHKESISKKMKGSYFINKNGINKRVFSLVELEKNINDGWSRGIDKLTSKNRKTGNHKGIKNGSFNCKLINNPETGRHKRVPVEKVSVFLRAGWELGWSKNGIFRPKFH